MKERTVEIAVFFNGRWNDRLKLLSSCTSDVDLPSGAIRDSVCNSVIKLLAGVSDAFLDEQFNKRGE